jgi:Family of unknown function (DUF5343)
MEELELVRRESVAGEETGVELISNGVEEHSDAKSQTPGKRNPPARNTSRFWFERFLAVIQRQNPTVIDSAFLKQIAPSNEGKLLAQLKFLKVIDDQGRPTELLVALNMVGQEQKKAFQQIAKEAYADLLAEIVVEKAVPDDLVNFFIRKYAFTREKGVYATKFFLYLAEKGSLSVSPELSAFLADKNPAQASPAGSVGLAGSAVRTTQQRVFSQRKNGEASSEKPLLQATINVVLDKDTPREYWDRVLALLGEIRNDESERSVQ